MSDDLVESIADLLGDKRFTAVQDSPDRAVEVWMVGKPDGVLLEKIKATATAHGYRGDTIRVRPATYSRVQLNKTHATLVKIADRDGTIQGRSISSLGNPENGMITVGLVDATDSELAAAENEYPGTIFLNKPYTTIDDSVRI